VKELEVKNAQPLPTQSTTTCTEDKTNMPCDACSTTQSLFDVVEAQLGEIRKEWPALKDEISENNHYLYSVAGRLDKKPVCCQEEISTRIKADGEVYVTGVGVSLAFQIRRSRYELEILSQHHFDFYKAFAKRLSRDLPEVVEIAASLNVADLLQQSNN